MVKKGDIIVRTKPTHLGNEPRFQVGFIFKALQNSESIAWYGEFSAIKSGYFRHATDIEIRAFKTQKINNISQIAINTFDIYF